MHAIVKAGEGPGVEWRRVPVPDPGPDEVLLLSLSKKRRNPNHSRT
jgi:hypothetical protein